MISYLLGYIHSVDPALLALSIDNWKFWNTQNA